MTGRRRLVAVLQHEPETGLGAFSRVLDDARVGYERVATTTGDALPDVDRFDAALVLGGSLNAGDPVLAGARTWIATAVSHSMPIFGICLGAQLLATALGGEVTRGPRPEIGVHDAFLTAAGRRDLLFENLPPRVAVLGWHEDTFTLPPGAVPLARSIAYRNQAFRWGASAYGVQFHLEAGAPDVARWATVRRYAEMLARAGADSSAVAAALGTAGPGMHRLARLVLERWLLLTTGLAAVRTVRLQQRGA